MLSYEIFPPGVEPITVRGSGTLAYDAFSNLTIDIRVDDATAAALQKAGIDLPPTGLSSNGRTAIDLEARTLTYLLDTTPAGAATGPLAVSRPRHWDVSGDVLTLTTRGDDGQAVTIGRWRRTR
jgi:hypothetical protein